MSENEPNFGAVELNNNYFGSLTRHEIYKILENGHLISIKELSDIYPHKKGTYTNEVELAELELYGIEKNTSSNNQEAVILEVESVEDPSKHIRVILKPFSGENKDIKRALSIPNFYSREKAAKIVDEFLGFNLVPPTLIAKLDNGDLASMQYFIEPEIARTRSELMDTDVLEAIDMQKSESWLKMAIFDWIIGNWDRNINNILQKESDPEEVIAIDNGSSWCHRETVRPPEGKKFGPRYFFKERTVKNESGEYVIENIKTPVPIEILTTLEKFKAFKNQINEMLLPLIQSHSELENMWKRVDQMLVEKIVL